MTEKLPPINFKEDIEKYEARQEVLELSSQRCMHREVRVEGTQLVCKCGAAWSGPRLIELLDGLIASATDSA